MERPNKIYATETDINGSKEQVWLSYPLRDSENIEYIRKDALLEWVIAKYNEYTKRMYEKNMDETHWGQRNAFQQVIDKINSL